MHEHRNIRWREIYESYEVSLTRKGRSFAKNFSSREYVSKEAALMAAISWRDEMRRKHGPRIVKTRNPRNKSGVIGARRVCKTNPSGKQYWSWVADWQIDDHTMVSRKFSVLKYGEEKARALAIAARNLGLQSASNAKARSLDVACITR